MTIDPEVSAPPWRARGAAALWAAVAVYVFVAAFPDWSVPGGDVLDGAWVAEVNRLAVRGFGRDLAFTYGPLGFLLYPTATSSHVFLALVLRIVVLGGIAAWVLRRGSAIDRLVFAVAQVAAAGHGLAFEYQLLVPAILLAAWALGRSRGAGAALAALAAVAGAALFMKFSTGVALAAIVGVAGLVELLRRRSRALPAAGLAALAALSTVVLLATALLAHPGDLLAWVRRSLELAGRYSEAMSLASELPGTAAEPGVAAAVLLCLVGAGIVGALRGSAAGRVALLAALPAFLAFKHAFVRQDSFHATLFFPFLLAVCAAAALVAPSRAERIGWRAGAALAAGLSLWVAAGYAVPETDWGSAEWNALSGHDGALTLAGWTRIKERRREIPERLARFVPPALAPALRGETLGVVPFSLAVCGVPGVRCTPNPTLQTFAAYTSGLDAWSGAHYLGERAPRYVLLHADGIDGRFPAFDHPALWRALTAAYALVAEQPGGGVLLERRSAFAVPRLVEVARDTAAGEGWVKAPDAAGPLYASIPLDATWPGRVRRAVFRVEPVLLLLEYPDGSQIAIRLVPDTARDGLPVDQLPLLPHDLSAAFAGGLSRRPARVAVVGPGLESYRQPIAITWLTPAAAPELDARTRDGARAR